MSTILVAFGAMLFIVAAMAVGVLMGRKPIAGTCGGMNALGMEQACDVCGGDQSRCDKENEVAADASDSANFYDATKR